MLVFIAVVGAVVGIGVGVRSRLDLCQQGSLALNYIPYSLYTGS